MAIRDLTQNERREIIQALRSREALYHETADKILGYGVEVPEEERDCLFEVRDQRVKELREKAQKLESLACVISRSHVQIESPVHIPDLF